MLRERIDAMYGVANLAFLPLTIVVSILGAGGVVGIVLSFRNEIRAGQAHDLLMAGESGQQARTDESHAVLIDASQRTLTLVNETLKLAHESSAQAARTMTQRAERALQELTDEANTLFTNARYHNDFDVYLLKIVVEEPQIRNDIQDIAQRLGSIEGYLEFQDLELTPAMHLVKGLDHHLRQDERRAIRALERAASTGAMETGAHLVEFARYWMGYASNNMGQFRQAAEVFSQARRLAEPGSSLYLDLARLEEESEFFEVTRHFFEAASLTDDHRRTTVRILQRLDGLYADATSGNTATSETNARAATARAHAIATTQGNVCLFLARAGDIAEAERAEHYFEHGGSDLWSRFGLLDARDARGLRPRKDDKAEYARLEVIAEEKTRRRAEPRSLALLYLTSAICMSRGGKAPSEVSGALRSLNKAFGDVDGALTLYSQRWKTNVSRGRFQSDDLAPLAEAPRVGARQRAPRTSARASAKS